MEKDKIKNEKLPEILNNHLFTYYRGQKGGLKAFCVEHNISYNSALKISRGSSEYPGVCEKIFAAISTDKQN